MTLKEKRYSVRLLQPESHHLIIKVYIIRFRIFSTNCNFFDIFREEKFEIIYSLIIFGPDDFVAEHVFILLHLLNFIAFIYQEFVCSSRWRYDKNDRASSFQNDDFEYSSVKTVLYSYEFYQYAAEAKFDLRRYNKYKSWLLYKFMIIQQNNDVTKKITLNIVHVTAFIQTRSVRKIITLAWDYEFLKIWK